jgi:hypothetical protein
MTLLLFHAFTISFFKTGLSYKSLCGLVLRYIFLCTVGGEVAPSEGGEATSAAGVAPAEGEEGKEEVSVTENIISSVKYYNSAAVKLVTINICKANQKKKKMILIS